MKLRDKTQRVHLVELLLCLAILAVVIALVAFTTRDAVILPAMAYLL